MVSFDEFVKRFDKVQPFIRKKSLEILMGFEKQVLDMIREQQLQGKGKDDKVMQSGYSTGYAKRRKKKGLQTRFVDLHFTGRFHKSLDMIPTKEGADVQSTEPYGQYVKANFPTSAGLGKANANTTSEMIANKLAPEIKKYLVG
jgi:hypothetical protein